MATQIMTDEELDRLFELEENTAVPHKPLNIFLGIVLCIVTAATFWGAVIWRIAQLFK